MQTINKMRRNVIYWSRDGHAACGSAKGACLRDGGLLDKAHQAWVLKAMTQTSAGNDRLPFVGNAEQMASDIRQFQVVGVGSIALDFLRQTENLDVMLGRMERYAGEVWPLE